MVLKLIFCSANKSSDMDKPVLSEQLSTNRKRLPIPLGCLLLIGLCISILFYFALADRIYPVVVNLIAPTPKQIDFGEPTLLLSDIPFFDSILWSKDGSMIQLKEEQEDIKLVFDVNSREEVTQDQKINFDAAPLKNDELKVVCPTQPYFAEVTLPGTNDEKPEYFILNLLKGVENAVFYVSPMQNDSPTYYLSPRDLVFSPDCKWLAIALWGDIGEEQLARDELWLLDVENLTIKFAFFGRRPAFGLFDYSVQVVQPSWSPNSKEFVFGDSQFGVEIYNVESKSRRWLLGPELAGYEPTWSSTGKWISMERWVEGAGEDLIVATADGKHYVLFDKCQSSMMYLWSPTEDQLMVECSIEHSENLWIWELPSPKVK